MTQEVLKLAEDYAKNRANYHIESLYGRSESYTATIKKEMLKAHQALKEALANHIEDNLVMVKKDDAWRNQLTRAQRNELKQIEDGTWEADRNG